MLFIYDGRSSQARIQQLTEPAKRGDLDARLRCDGHAGADRVIEHPCGDLKDGWRFGGKPTLENGLPRPRDRGDNEDVTPEPGMERIANRPDIDQSGLVLTSSTIPYVLIRVWATGR
jgi:hypothetical protein